ncbi:PHA/PHB synthase family protein [Denitrobaculum tricleocarpae]|uniref:Class I poly(R)-hydroxyalkanoic acid synthase n=1 Tax=Denitrobaculum tricleocarpae TaxID=2591009 RepID=A0A545TT69_9PROT|nr:class I poly(R)-hydroxyalkanoic acid synthase [Denitrobaculum tricleocarpae]TQV80413.1 class I poly(R)-hydroxyalkanoic acid synthase [Denitrobaculum tricleocarpae]
MVEQPSADDTSEETQDLATTLSTIAEQSSEMVSDFLKETYGIDYASQVDPLNIGGAFLELTTRMMTNPALLVQAQMSLWKSHMDLWHSTTQRMLGHDVEPTIEPEQHDRRFRHEAWEDNELFDYIKQSYLLSARWLRSTVKTLHGKDEHEAEKIDFFTRQFVDALAPSNFMLTNPEVLEATMESGGQNLLKGLDHLLHDLRRGGGQLKISMTDDDAFALGENVAITPGKVIFQNDLIQLIQYEPSTKKVAERPVLIIPPWINKYYILDLRPENSFIQWMVDQGQTVFCISWVNPDETLAQKTFEDYMFEGPLAAIDVIQKATGRKDVNAVGYCLGGTLLSVTLAYLAVKKKPLVHAATFIATLTDFSEPGELGVFIDDEQVTLLEEKMAEKGYLEGKDMAATFNLLRANDLIWSFVVNNYLLGKEPFPFDLLYWNEDATRMPAAMHSFYLRKMYLENLLAVPGGIELGGVPIDLAKIKVPVYMVSAREDHIAPWRSTYLAIDLFNGPIRFVLTAAGHIAGVVNPPHKNKYAYWTNSRRAKHPEVWYKNAKKHDGSWWNDWAKWLHKHQGKDVAARKPGGGKIKVIEDAPGSYVRVSILHEPSDEPES